MNKGLRALKKIEKEMTRLCGIDIAYDGKVFNLFRIAGKELQALEIIKEKQVNCYDIINSIDYKHYVVLMKDYDKSWLLTQEEYNLLKEILL